jgi:aryl-alcohol dehydrogenase-like predicted oxidoreductase
VQVDVIDLYQLHWPDRYVPLFGKYQFKPDEAPEREVVAFEESVEAVGDLIKAGKIRHWGLSNETAYGITMMCETAKRLGVPLPVSVQNDYSICDRCALTTHALHALCWRAARAPGLRHIWQAACMCWVRGTERARACHACGVKFTLRVQGV